jgi:tetratricopeptide (TPR) repeat protein
VPRDRNTVEDLLRLLPGLEELEELRLAIVGAAELDPAKRWESSSAVSTIDKRVVPAERIEAVIDEAKTALHGYVDSLFAGLRPVLGAVGSGNGDAAARHLIGLGERLEATGRLRKARQCFDVALTLALPLPDKALQILALRRIARVAQTLGELQEALDYYRRSAGLARDAQELGGEVIALTGWGNVLAVQGRWEEAERQYRAALARLESGGAEEALRLQRGQLFNNLGMITTHLRRLPEAEAWFDRALELWTLAAPPTDLAICYHNLGLLREQQGERDEARRIYEQALALDIPAALRAAIAIEIADLHLKENRVRQAERWGRVAEQHAIAARSPYYLGEMYRGLGNIARAQGTDAFIFYEKALEIAQQKEYLLLEAQTLMEYALFRTQNGGAEEAVSYLERAGEIFGSLNAVHEEQRARRLREELAEKIASAAPE